MLAILLAIALAAAQSAPGDDEVRLRARALLAALAAQEFTAFTRDFTDEMKAAMPPARLGATWSALVAQAGAFKQCAADSRVAEIADKRMVITACEFERASIDVQLAFDAAGRISGMALRPAARAVAYTLPPYATPGYTEAEVTVGGPDWPLPGTLTLPPGDGPFPALVLVHGSGPNDRDGTVGRNKPLKDLALGLASRGVAVLRYEKRSKAFGARMAQADGLTVKDEVLSDAAAALGLLRGHPRIDRDRVFLAGHSLGATLVPRILAAAPPVAGAVLLAAAARPLEDMIVEQCRYLAMADGTISPAEQEQIDAVVRLAADVKGLRPGAPAARLGGATAAYWLDLRDYDAPAAAASLQVPLLVLQGERDYQVTMTDFGRWRRALGGRNDVTFKSYASLNHLFMPGSGRSLPAEYDVPSHVDEQVVRDIAEWLSRVGGRR